MPFADLVISGTVLTVDDARPTAEAVAVSDGRIVAIGSRTDIESWLGPDTQTLDTGDGCVMPGLVEAHGHPLMEAVVLSDRMVDIRPVTMRDADAIVGAIRREVATRGSDGAYLNGWDPLLQPRRAGALTGAINPGDYPAMLHAELGRLNRAGLTTCSEMAFDPAFRPILEQMRDAGLARRRGAGHPAGDRPQLRAQGLLQHRRRTAGGAHPRHPQAEHRCRLFCGAVEVTVGAVAVLRALRVR